MKILYYNWVPFDEKKGRGGGVSVYLRDLIESMISSDPLFEIWFLSSGYYYDDNDRSLRYEEISNKYGKKCRTFTILNSPVVSPAYFSFFSLDILLDDTRLGELFESFLNVHGPFDVVHYHNLEGLSLSVFNKHFLFKDTAFIYTMHNYYALCPQVNLWREEMENCMLTDTGKECLNCMREHVPLEKLSKKKTYEYILKKKFSSEIEKEYKIREKEIDKEFFEEEHRMLYDYEKERIIDAAGRYRKTMIKTLNDMFDLVIGVSKRTCVIAEREGVSPRVIRQVYIGSKIAEDVTVSKHVEDKKVLSIIYMGYQRKDKGYNFFAECMNKLYGEVASRINLTIAAKSLPKTEMIMIDKNKFAGYTYMDGYKREEIKEMLKGQDLGIVPVLWEDNLPQVAIEMVANGVPILTSDRGGASELTDNENFVFKAGDMDEFIECIRRFVENPNFLNDYWSGFHGLTTMEEHINTLKDIYNSSIK